MGSGNIAPPILNLNTIQRQWLAASSVCFTAGQKNPG